MTRLVELRIVRVGGNHTVAPDQSAPDRRPATRLRTVLLDSFYRNSLLLIFNYAVVGVLAFVFWAVAARQFPAAEIGDVTALFAGLTFVSIAAGFGLQNTVVRYLANEPNRHAFLLGATVLVGIGAVALTLLIIAVPGHIGLPVVGEAGWIGNVLVFTLTVLMTVGAIADAAMIGLRATGVILAKNTLAGLVRIAALLFVSGTGEQGLLTCLGLSASVATLGALAGSLRRLGRRPPGRLRPLAALSGKVSFSAGNHIATLLSSGPLFVLPSYAVHILGSEQAAYLAASLNLMMALNAVPTTISQSLFAELASRSSERFELTMRAFRTVYSIMIPIVALVCLLASVVLSFFGEDYTAASTCLRLMAIGAVFGAFNYVADVVLNATGRIGAFTVVNVVGAIAVLSSAMVLGTIDLTFLGVGWLVGQIAYTVVASTALAKTGVLRKPVARHTA